MSPEKEVCCCIYIDKQKNVYYSTNRLGKYLNYFNQGFMKDMPSFSNLVINDFNSQSINDFFKSALEENNQRYQRMLDRYLKKVKILKRKNPIIWKLISEKFYNSNLRINDGNHHKWISDLFNRLSAQLLSVSLDKESLKIISDICLYCEDFLNVAELNKDENGKIIIDSFKKGHIRRINCHGDHRTVHCEMRAWEHISNDNNQTITKNTYDNLTEAVEQGRFVVSKFGCGFCSLSFFEWEKVVNRNRPSNLNRLGNSCSFFLGWISPQFKNESDETFKDTQLSIHNKLELISELERLHLEPLIENSQAEYLVNQIIVPEAFN